MLASLDRIATDGRIVELKTADTFTRANWGAPGVDGELALLKPTTMLVSSVGEQTVCLLALEPGRVPEFGRAVRDLAARDIVSRVEAEPHL